MKSCLILLLSLFLSCAAQAKNPQGLGIFVKQEINATDKIISLGLVQRINFSYSELGAETTTNISYAEVLTEEGYFEDYMAWEMGVKFGYFSEFFFYIEAGIDLAEGLLDAERYDDDCCYDHYYAQSNDLDGYAGLGFGFQFERTRLELSARARQIDSAYWHSDAYLFYGAQLTIAF